MNFDLVRPFIFSTFILLLTFLNLGAQPTKFSANNLLSQSSFIQWNGDNGLISNNLTSAIRDREGFVWITSYNGIMRFDGTQISVFDQTKIPVLSSGAFYSAYEDDSGALWFSSQTSGIIVYKSGKFERIDPERKVLPRSIRCLKFLEDGTIWVGSNNRGLYKIQNGQATKVQSQELDSVSVLDIANDSAGNLWVATDGKGLYKYHGKVFESIAGLGNQVVNTLCFSPDGKALFIGTSAGLDIWRDNKITHSEILKDQQINKIISDKYNRIWLGTEIGLGRIRLNNQGTFEYLAERDGYPLSRITFLYFDDEENLWVSTGRDGLVQMHESSIINITPKEGLSANRINIVTEGPDHLFYLGSDGGSIDTYKRGEINPLKIETEGFNSSIRDIYADQNGTLWIGSYKGLLMKSGKQEKLYDFKDGIVIGDIRRVLPAEGNNLWLGTRSGGVIKFGQGKVIAQYGKGKGLESNYILALEKDTHENLYVGTHSGGISVIHSDGKTETFHIDKEDDGILIFNIHMDEQKRIWTVGNTGIFSFDGNKFIRIPLTKSLTGEVFFDWVEDRIGNVWITSNVGVLKIVKSDIEDFISGKIREVDFRLFDNNDGMKGKECTAATRSLLSSTGLVWVPTLNGISIFNASKISINKTPPPVFITSVKADEKEFNILNPVLIEPGNLRYTFNYTSPSFISPRKIRFRYKLENVDASWIEAGVSRQAEYTNLAPGKYVFRVLACNSDGVWNEQGTSIAFVVKPFFYQTILFYAVLLAGSIFLLYMIYKWRVNTIERRNKELRKVNDELDRFVYSASHDLRAPLASILGLVNVARMDKGNNFESYLDKIEKSVTKLDGFIRDIIDFSRNARTEIETEIIDFKILINDVFENLKYLDDKNRIKHIVKVEAVGEFCSDKKRLTVILNNLVANAIKYSNPYAEDSFIEVIVNQSSSFASLQIADNGIGIAPQHIDHIFKMFYRGDEKSRGSGIGLYIVKETLGRIGGNITVQSKYGYGSTFTITLNSLRPVAAGALPQP